ncbi:MAG: hypothetical protein HY075_08660 [Deltaproteobacteria bacterium]|nr:hypothetical protein [Deltaproteobacteria bacterium]
MFLTQLFLPLAALASVVSGESILAKHRAEVDALLARKSYSEAVQTALKAFNLDASNCRGVDTHFIEARDGEGHELIAHTRLDQIVVLDPRQTAFKNARYLVSVLAHEIAHCDQNQQLFSLAVRGDPQLAKLRNKVNLLRVLAELDELAGVALKDSPAKADANARFKQLAARYGLELTPPELLALSRRFIEDVASYKRPLDDLLDMEAGLRAFEAPGAVPPPSAGQKPSEEFAYHYRFLLVSTNKFLRQRQLLGADAEMFCRLANVVPFELTMHYERICADSVRMVRDFISRIPE